MSSPDAQAGDARAGAGRTTPAPQPSFRLIPSRFPPIGLFDTVATAADLPAVMELVGWTNDRLVAERLSRLPREQWVYGRPNASIVMAAFLHAPAEGGRFSGRDLGAWYAAATLVTAIAEVAHHLRRELAARNIPAVQRTFRSYVARLDGAYCDIRGEQAARPGAYAVDSHAASQAFGEAIRRSGGFGVVWDSVRHVGGTCVVAFQPRAVQDVAQGDHLRIGVRQGERRIEAALLRGG